MMENTKIIMEHTRKMLENTQDGTCISDMCPSGAWSVSTSTRRRLDRVTWRGAGTRGLRRFQESDWSWDDGSDVQSCILW